MISSSLKPTTTITRASSPSTERMQSSCRARIVRPLVNGVNGFGNGLPSREPNPAARITIDSGKPAIGDMK